MPPLVDNIAVSVREAANNTNNLFSNSTDF